MSQFEDRLEKYAKLAVRTGVNVQKGQRLIIQAPIEAASFVRAAARQAYAAGAKSVHVEWQDDELTRIAYQEAPEEGLTDVPLWRGKGLAEMAAEGAAFLFVLATNPRLLEGIDAGRIAKARSAARAANKVFTDYTHRNEVSWTIVSVPTAEWAMQVFPGATREKSVEKLWDAIFSVTRSDQPDPVAAWEEHISALKRRIAFLNASRFRKLHYRAPGTDLTVELPEGHLWVGGSMENARGDRFIPNVPTEEVFTSPHKDRVSGVVSSTKPLNYSGALIENFSLTFEQGKVVSFTAEKGYDNLKQLLETDEGASRLGEVALVPHRSPVSDTGIIFYNTLFDENASCHVALGLAFSFSLEGGGEMSKEQLAEKGLNDSLTHVDFMIGSAELDIDGETAQGERIPLFRQGNWVE